jgi:hypothetical protein
MYISVSTEDIHFKNGTIRFLPYFLPTHGKGSPGFRNMEREVPVSGKWKWSLDPYS